MQGVDGSVDGPEARWRFLDATVDRICQSAWPEHLGVRTEPYYEWTVESHDPVGIPSAAETVDDLRPNFDRKRFLVNTTADAFAFLGVEKGLRYLHEAATDSKILERCAPAFAELRHLLELTYGFAPAATQSYHQSAICRLAEPGLARPLETVARSARRKLGPAERFVAPAGALLERATLPTGLASLIAEIVRIADITPAELRDAWSGRPWRDALSELVFGDSAPSGTGAQS